VVVIDPAVGWAALSEAFDLVLGYDRQAPPAVSLLDLVHPEDQPLAVGSYVDVCAGRGGGGPFDLRVRTATGRWRTLEVAVRGLLDDPPVGAVAYLGIDATAQRASERSLREEVERLRNATQAGGAGGASGAGGANGASGAGAANGASGAGAAAFMPSVAHELRGPLSSVVAFGHLLGDPGSGTLTDDQRAYLDVIDRNANRLLRLIEELLLLSRLQAGAVALKPAAVRVPALVEEVVAERAESARAVGVALAWDAIEGVELVCDEARVQQALANLLANGLAFTPADGRVTIAARPIETGWQFVVSDTGIGIPAADQPKLFTPFFRASNVGSVNAPDSPGSRAGRRATNPGAGLGLSISRAIVELHGGVIDVASTEGVGTTVTVSLPLHPRMKDGG
jgi:signal transduction histidine kinase